MRKQRTNNSVRHRKEINFPSRNGTKKQDKEKLDMIPANSKAKGKDKKNRIAVRVAAQILTRI